MALIDPIQLKPIRFSIRRSSISKTSKRLASEFGAEEANRISLINGRIRSTSQIANQRVDIKSTIQGKR